MALFTLMFDIDHKDLAIDVEIDVLNLCEDGHDFQVMAWVARDEDDKVVVFDLNEVDPFTITEAAERAISEELSREHEEMMLGW
jgi:hypothetical protein